MRVVASLLALSASAHSLQAQAGEIALKGYDVTVTGLTPKYPDGCKSPLTSLYASWIDVDGSRRVEAHSGVDGGRLNDWILSPGPGTVRAVWQADWGWGREGALLILHTPQDLGLASGPSFYSEFDHLNFEEVKRFQVGDKVWRGERLARVFRPGGQKKYREEVHWEVWEVNDDSALQWRRNKYKAQSWTNNTARLIDPLYMMSLENGVGDDGSVSMTPFVHGQDYSAFKGFTYIFPCTSKSRTP